MVLVVGCSQPDPVQSTSSRQGRTGPTVGDDGRDTVTPDDRRGDLVRGTRTLTGTVERNGTCISLLTDGGQWALSGPAVAVLTPGERVEVTGHVTDLPTTCTTLGRVPSLRVSRVRPI
jgi:hypothetical protein